MLRKETTMNEMVERVARAIGRSFMPADVQLEAHIYTFLRSSGRDPADANTKLELMMQAAAQAAIEAMRDPTDEMVTAGDTTFADYEGWGPPRETWPLMIDAALSDAA